MRYKEEIVATISTLSPLCIRDRRMERLGGRFDSPTVRERPNKNLVKSSEIITETNEKSIKIKTEKTKNKFIKSLDNITNR